MVEVGAEVCNKVHKLCVLLSRDLVNYFIFYILIMNKKILILTGLAVVGLLTLGLSSASAYRGDYSKVGPNHTEEREAAMVKVMEEKDYEGWKTLMTENGRNPGVLSKVDSQEDFERFARAWELGKEGKVQEANQIRSELNLGNGQGKRAGNRTGNCTRAE